MRQLLDRGYAVLGVDAKDTAEVEGADFRTVRLGELDDEPDVDWGVSIAHAFLAAGGALPAEVAGVVLAARDTVRATLENNLVAALDGIEVVRRARRRAPMDSMGSITLVSSVNALGPFGLPIYSAAKASLNGLTASLAPELAREGLRLNCVLLGTVLHPGVESLHHEDDQHFERLRSSTLTGNFLTPESAARALIGIGIDQPGIVGQTLVVDHGQTASGRT